MREKTKRQFVFTMILIFVLQALLLICVFAFTHNTAVLVAGGIISVAVFLVVSAFYVLAVKSILNSEEKEKLKADRLESEHLGAIRALATAIDSKDRYTVGHSARVTDYAVRIAEKLGKTEEEIKTITYAALLHDVGKIRIPDGVLNKPGKLTDEEFELIRIHPISSFHILKDVFENENILYAAKYHHERYDGRGYPSGIAGDNIPEIARIIAVADAYDAMASNRSYRKALPQDVVRAEIEKGRGTQFDPKMADIMLAIIDEDSEYSLKQEKQRNWNILVVDDEKMSIQVIKRILKDDKDITLFDAVTPEDALKIFEEQDISLVLLDLIMPGIDGFTLYRQLMHKKKVPVIIMTGDKSTETVNKIRELGIDDYITKPLGAVMLKETIRGVLNGR